MAVSKVLQSAKLVIKVETGVNTAGKPVYRQRSYTNVKPSAADADLHAVAAAMAGLQKHPVNSIVRIDDSELVEA